MDDQASGVANIGKVRKKLQRLDEFCSRFPSANAVFRELEGENRAGAFRANISAPGRGPDRSGNPA